LRGQNQLPKVIDGVKFKDGIEDAADMKSAADSLRHPISRVALFAFPVCRALPIPCLPTSIATALARPIASSTALTHLRPARSALRSKKVVSLCALSQLFKSAATALSLRA
jgi:hypothetical protein